MTLISIFLILIIVWSYYFPVQRLLAERAYESYSAEQQALTSDIIAKEVYKDYKQGGYYISVVYKNNPDYRYLYHYFLIDFRKDGVKFNMMYCDIYDSENNLLDMNEWE